MSPDNDCPEALLADSTACKVHRCALGDPEAAIGKTRGGHNTKVHVGVEPDGTVRTVVLTAGNVSDCLVMKDTLGGLRPLRVIADKGYDTDRCRRDVREAGAVPVILDRENRRKKHGSAPKLSEEAQSGELLCALQGLYEGQFTARQI